ncbi:MAG: hypothetical protein HPY44_15645 [Armatimonadetes bacterium]|nr:hypothetical protein [Armatimonadota bacterium]
MRRNRLLSFAVVIAVVLGIIAPEALAQPERRPRLRAVKGVVLVGELDDHNLAQVKRALASIKLAFALKGSAGPGWGMNLVLRQCADEEIPELVKQYNTRDVAFVLPITQRTIEALQSRNPREAGFMVQVPKQHMSALQKIAAKAPPGEKIQTIDLTKEDWQPLVAPPEVGWTLPGGGVIQFAADRAGASSDFASSLPIGFTDNPYATFINPGTGQKIPGAIGPFLPMASVSGIIAGLMTIVENTSWEEFSTGMSDLWDAIVGEEGQDRSWDEILCDVIGALVNMGGNMWDSDGKFDDYATMITEGWNDFVDFFNNDVLPFFGTWFQDDFSNPDLFGFRPDEEFDLFDQGRIFDFLIRPKPWEVALE